LITNSLNLIGQQHRDAAQLQKSSGSASKLFQVEFQQTHTYVNEGGRVAELFGQHQRHQTLDEAKVAALDDHAAVGLMGLGDVARGVLQL